MKIRFCENNKGSGKVFKKLKETFPDMNIKRKDCIKSCDTCKKTLTALVDGKTVTADNADEFYKMIVAAITSKPAL